jgi:hypothetical protein
MVATVVDHLKATSPEILLFGFEQPLGVPQEPSLGRGLEVESLTDKTKAIDLLIRYTKLSTYCLRKREFSSSDREFLQARIGTDYFFVTLALRLFLMNPSGVLLLDRRTLAGSRRDFNVKFRFPLDVAANFSRAVDVPGFREHASRSGLAALHTDRRATLLNNLRRHYLGTLTFTDEAVDVAERKWRQIGLLPRTPIQAIRQVQYWNARHVPPPVAQRIDQLIEKSGKAVKGLLR